MAQAAGLALRVVALARPAGIALRSPAAWTQFVKFCTVGATGTAVNLVVYRWLLREIGLFYAVAAVGAFLVAVTNNYLLNRFWTFAGRRRSVATQGMEYLVVSTIALGGNVACLALLVTAGIDPLPAQMIAVVLVTPFSFAANKLWTFRR